MLSDKLKSLKCISTLLIVDDVFTLFTLLFPFLVSAFALELWGDFSDSRNYTFNYVYDTPFGLVVVAIDADCHPRNG